MSAPIILIENLSKKYLVVHQTGQRTRSRYTALRDVVAREMRNAVHKTIDAVRGRQVLQGDEVEEFWALQDVSFEIQRGEVLGIIGRNGAGKSTLLKILSRITEPTQGRVTLRGRVASLLEIGTGFHPELTGRENVFLNGAILGMSQAEIRRKFDEIVAFAEVEKFLDTPVKHYSSGMYVRLAFAVAAHLEPQILIVDEVLAVGDVEFQKKCLGKMDEVSRREGRTVLFVSHNMDAITRLCTRCLLLRKGTIITWGAPIDVIGRYFSHNEVTTAFHRPLTRSSNPMIVGASWLQSDQAARDAVIDIKLIISSQRRTSVSIDVRLRDRYLNPIGFGSLGAFESTRPVPIDYGINEILVNIDTKYLALGEYIVSFDLTDPFVEFYDRVEDCIRFAIYSNRRANLGRQLEQSWGYGSALLPLSFKTLVSGNINENEMSHVSADGCRIP